MDSSTEELLPGPATYVPEPFQGLPPVFGESDASPRGWRPRHRPGREARRRRTTAQDTVARSDAPAPPPRAAAPTHAPIVAAPPPPPRAPIVAAPPPPPRVLIVTPPAAPAAPPPPPVVAAPAPAFEQVPATSANLPTYRPEPYDPKTAGAVLPATDILQLYGVVLPKRRNRAARFLLALLVVALAGSGFYAWRQLQHTKHSGGPITFTSAAGKFMARFPHAPITQVRTWHYDHDIRAVLHVAADSDDHALVMGARLTPSPSNRAITAALPTVGRGLAGDGTLIPADQHRIVFQGHSALEGELWAPDGTTVSFLVVNYGGGQLYFLLAPAGPTFTDLTASFVALR